MPNRKVVLKMKNIKFYPSRIVMPTDEALRCGYLDEESDETYAILSEWIVLDIIEEDYQYILETRGFENKDAAIKFAENHPLEVVRCRCPWHCDEPEDVIKISEEQGVRVVSQAVRVSSQSGSSREVEEE